MLTGLAGFDRQRRRWAPGDDAGGSPPASDAGQGDAGTGDATGGDTPGNGGAGKTFTQAELDTIIADRLKREKERGEAERKKAQDTEREKALAEQQKFRELAEERASRIAELEGELTPTQERFEAYKGALAGYLERERGGLPEATLELLDKLDVVDQLEWISKHKGDAQETPSGGRRPGINAGDGRGQPPPRNPEDKEREVRQRFRL